MTGEITEAMVEAAVKAFNDTYYSVEYSKRHSIQSAVEAALAARTAPEARSVVERLRADLIEAQAAQIASLSAKVAEVERAGGLIDEGLEILNNLIDSVKRHGNYSPESTCTFIDQAGQAFRAARAAAAGGSNG